MNFKPFAIKSYHLNDSIVACNLPKIDNKSKRKFSAIGILEPVHLHYERVTVTTFGVLFG